jgi:formylglycine-generating enzyme required for sulfatase activity
MSARLSVLGMLELTVLFAACGQRGLAGEPSTTVKITNTIGMKLVLIPAGEFMMGSPESEEYHEDEEYQHRVRITKPYYLGVYEVTQEEYERVMGTSPSYFSSSGWGKDEVSGEDTSRFPVESVSWEEAVEFCRKLSSLPEEKAESRSYRLPTEAEWEYACRAGTTTLYGFGDDPASLGEYAWKRDNSDRKTHPVGEKKPNAWGLYDMHGNVWEWCQDRYGEDYYAGSPTDDPPGPEKGSGRVLRGGSWSTFPRNCRSAPRGWHTPGYRDSTYGFRVALGPVDASGS